MKFMNQWDIEDAVNIYQGHPILGPATRTLSNLVEWTNCNSDGWAYWPKPARAAARLMTIIDSKRYDMDREDVTAVDIRKALSPIKAFRTKQGADFVIEEL
jgi:hypothetical protein